MQYDAVYYPCCMFGNRTTVRKPYPVPREVAQTRAGSSIFDIQTTWLCNCIIVKGTVTPAIFFLLLCSYSQAIWYRSKFWCLFGNRDHKLRPDPVPRAVALFFWPDPLYLIYKHQDQKCVEYMVDVMTCHSGNK